MNGGRLYLQDNYRPITVQSGQHGLIERIDTDDPGPGNGYPLGHSDAIVGIKLIGYLTDFGSSDRSLRDWTIRDNVVAGVDEEGISADPNGNHGADAMVRGTGSVSAVNAANNTVTLSGANHSGLVNAYVVFNTGGSKGRHLKITGISGNTVTVADPDNRLANVSAGNGVSVGGPFLDIKILNNTVDISGGFCGICWGGFVFETQVRDNTINGNASRTYQSSFNLRPGAKQAFRHGALTDMPGTGQIAAAAYNSVTGNRATGNNMDFSWHHRGPGSLNGLPTYRANNTPGPGGQLWDTPGDYTFLSSDPNGGGPPPPPPSDADGDGVPDASDNCVNTSNPGQEDEDADNIGDVCDDQDNRDPDGDGFENWEDNCDGTANPQQTPAEAQLCASCV